MTAIVILQGFASEHLQDLSDLVYHVQSFQRESFARGGGFLFLQSHPFHICRAGPLLVYFLLVPLSPTPALPSDF